MMPDGVAAGNDFDAMRAEFERSHNMTFTLTFSVPAKFRGLDYGVANTVMVFANDEQRATVDWFAAGYPGEARDEQWTYDNGRLLKRSGDARTQRPEAIPAEDPVISAIIQFSLAALDGFPTFTLIELDDPSLGMRQPSGWQAQRAFAELGNLPEIASNLRVVVQREHSPPAKPTALFFQDRTTGAIFRPQIADLSLDVPTDPSWFSADRPTHCFPPTVPLNRGGELVNYPRDRKVTSCLPHYHGLDKHCNFRCEQGQSW